MKLLSGCCVSKWLAVRAGSQIWRASWWLTPQPTGAALVAEVEPHGGHAALGQSTGKFLTYLTASLESSFVCLLSLGLGSRSRALLHTEPDDEPNAGLSAMVNWDFYVSKSKEGLLALFWGFGTWYQNICSAITYILSSWKREIKAYLFLHVNALFPHTHTKKALLCKCSLLCSSEWMSVTCSWGRHTHLQVIVVPNGRGSEHSLSARRARWGLLRQSTPCSTSATFLGNAVRAAAHNLPPGPFPSIGGAAGYKGAWERERKFFATKEAQSPVA